MLLLWTTSLTHWLHQCSPSKRPQATATTQQEMFLMPEEETSETRLSLQQPFLNMKGGHHKNLWESNHFRIEQPTSPPAAEPCNNVYPSWWNLHNTCVLVYLQPHTQCSTQVPPLNPPSTSMSLFADSNKVILFQTTLADVSDPCDPTRIMVHARCRVKAALKITGFHSYVTALRFCCVCSQILVGNTHMHQSNKLVAFYCLQASNQCRSATMPSSKGEWVG